MNRCACILFLLLAGCTTHPLISPPQIKGSSEPAMHRAVQWALVQPRLRGPAWTAPADFDPMIEWFEVWATTNLAQPFTLKTNTTATQCLWPEQAAEFYKVRTVNIYGEHSAWATTR
jgi:hypothetical protein